MFFFFKQKTAYEMRISDWSSDVCSSDLVDEVDLILKHEAEARAYRQIYAQFTKARRAVNQLQKAYDMLSGRSLKAAMQGKAVLNEADSEEIGRASCRERVCQYV